MSVKHPHPGQPNRWTIGIGLGAAAAAIAGLLIIPNIGSKDTLREVPANTGLPPVTTTTTTVTTTTTIEPATIIARGESIVARVESSEQPTVFEAAGSAAINGGDGFIYLSPPDDAAPGTPIRAFDVRAGSITDVPAPNETGQRLQLHDVAVVQGQTTLLYTVDEPPCSGGGDPACVTSLRTYQPATGVGTVLTERKAWEASWSAWHLADNGIVFGAENGLVTEAPEFFNISSGVTPTLESIGLDEFYSECDDCPTSFTIDRAGAHVAWIDGPAGARQIVITELATGAVVEVPFALDPEPADAFKPTQGSLQIADLELSNGVVVRGQATFNPPQYNLPVTPLFVDLTTGEATPFDRLPEYQGLVTPGSFVTLS